MAILLLFCYFLPVNDDADTWPLLPVEVGSRRTATRLTCGATSLKNSSHFALRPYSKLMKPVALPPGCFKLIGIKLRTPMSLKLRSEPAQSRFPVACRNIFNFPGLCRTSRDRSQSELAVSPRNAAPVSGLDKHFPGPTGIRGAGAKTVFWLAQAPARRGLKGIPPQRVRCARHASDFWDTVLFMDRGIAIQSSWGL